jgi:hypothetical protein
MNAERHEISLLFRKHLDEVVRPEFEKLDKEFFTEEGNLSKVPVWGLDVACQQFSKLTQKRRLAHQEMRRLHKDAGLGRLDALTHFVNGSYLRPEDATDFRHIRDAVTGHGAGDGVHSGTRTTYGGRASA